MEQTRNVELSCVVCLTGLSKMKSERAVETKEKHYIDTFTDVIPYS